MLNGTVRCIAESAAQTSTQLGLTEDQVEFQAVAQEFAKKELLPYAAEWDARKHFPVDKLRAAAQLGFGGILVGDDVGQQQFELVTNTNIGCKAVGNAEQVQEAARLAEQMLQ